jgi:hypothetical protein
LKFSRRENGHLLCRTGRGGTGITVMLAPLIAAVNTA